MKTFQFTLVFILFLTACNNQKKEKVSGKNLDTNKTVLVKDSVFADDKDSVVIENNYDRTVYTKGKLRRILKQYPELGEEALAPDLAYAKAELRPSFDTVFRSEVGQDYFYQLYAYFQDNKFKKNKTDSINNKLTSIYLSVNDLFDQLRGGGTYFGHQEARISGYVAYDVQNFDFFKKDFNIKKQKELYLSSLQQLIDDEVLTNKELNNTEKQKLKNDLAPKLKELNRLITNYFYLKMCEKFQYACY